MCVEAAEGIASRHGGVKSDFRSSGRTGFRHGVRHGVNFGATTYVASLRPQTPGAMHGGISELDTPSGSCAELRGVG